MAMARRMFPECMTAVAVAASALVPGSARAQSAPACPGAAADDRSVLVSVIVADDAKRLGATIDTVLQDLGYHVSTAESGIGQWVTHPKLSWPQGAENDSWHGTAQPGVQLVVDVAPDSAGTRLSIAANAVCRVSPSADAEKAPGSVESQLESASAMEAAVGIGQHLALQRKPAGQ